MQYFLYHLSLNASHQDPSTWTEADHAALNGHLNFLNQLGDEGKLIFAGRTDMPMDDPMLFGIALVMADTLEAAIEMMAGDPAVVAGIQSSQVLPYRLAVQHFQNVSSKDQ